MLNKRIRILFGFYSFILLIASLLFVGNNSIIASLNAGDNGTWVHYQKREATSSSKGIREYWVKCGGAYQFSAPESGKIEEASSYNETGFTTNDPRYIFYIEDDKSIFYEESSSSYNYDEVSKMSGYIVASVPTELGAQTRMEFKKDNLSPLYSANITRVTDVISSKSELEAFQDKIEAADVMNGYYVLTADITNPTKYITRTTSKFGGTFDGRGHTISNPTFWQKRMFGDTITGGFIKNINFTNIRLFSILCIHFLNSTLENVNFSTQSSISTNSYMGMLFDAIEGQSNIKNCVIDFGENYVIRSSGDHKTALVAAYNSTPKDWNIFENTVIRCLPSADIFLIDNYNRGNRPVYSGLTYVSTCYFIKNGTLNYSLKYLAGNQKITEAANYIKDAIYNITGKTILMSSFSSTEKFSKDDPNIVIGSDSSLEDLYISSPSETGDYFVKSIGKSIFINCHDDYSYQAATQEFLLKAFGYESFYKNRNSLKTVYTNTVKDKNNIDGLCVNVESNSPFRFKRIDQFERYHVDIYSAGFNCGGTNDLDVYFDIPGIEDDVYMKNRQRFHTTTVILYPGTYKSSHDGWYSIDSKGNHPAIISGSYLRWQLCFTARGNENEYNAMVNETALKVKQGYDNRKEDQQNSNVFCLGIGDNDYYCECSACKAKVAEYGAISGTLIKFLNDVQTKLDNDYGEGLIELWTLGYKAFKDAPIKNGVPTINSKANVMVAPVESNFTYPINDDVHNAGAHQLFEDWGKVGKISSWLYETNYQNFLYPYNSWEAIPESIKYMATANVDMAYVEGQYNCHQYTTGFNQLKVYLKGKFMNNPYTSVYSTAVDNYFNGYFGSGASEMRTFFNELKTRMATFETNETYKAALYAGGAKSINSHIDSKVLWDKTQLERWISLCDSAYSKVTDAEMQRRILAESIFPKWCLVTSFADTYDSATLLAKRKSFKNDADSLLITLIRESSSEKIQDYYSKWGIA